MNEQIEYQIQVIRLKRIQELTNRLKLALQRERILLLLLVACMYLKIDSNSLFPTNTNTL